MKKKSLLLVSAVMLALSLSACSSYISSYAATMMVTSEHSDTASLSFLTFEGKKAFTLNNSAKTTGEVSYTAELKSGNATVYYDDNGTKTEWFTIGAGDKLSGSTELDNSSKIHIIIETDGKCENGSFDFNLN